MDLMAQKKKITLKEIAKLSGFSISTVSYALNDVYTEGINISKNTRNHIKAVAKEHNYMYSEAARTVKTGKSKIIAYVSSYLESDPVLLGVADAVNEYGYSLKFFKADANLVKMCVHENVCAVIFHTNASCGKFAGRLREHKILVATIGATDVNNCIHIRSDNAAGIASGMEHLYKNGHRRIGFAVREGSSRVTKERCNAYKNYMEQKKLECIYLKTNHENFPQALKHFEILQKKYIDNFPTAFICSNNISAQTLCAIASLKNLSVPGDFSVLGYGYEQYFDFLGHIDEQSNLMGHRVVSLLIDSIKNGDKGECNELFPTRLKPGYSTGKLKKM